ncbi:MAG: hypothetical protein FJ271_21035 [Planctomycetes bacterium]|nr:hypothetical protein [Planctomycetota bacterium]
MYDDEIPVAMPVKKQDGQWWSAPPPVRIDEPHDVANPNCNPVLVGEREGCDVELASSARRSPWRTLIASILIVLVPSAITYALLSNAKPPQHRPATKVANSKPLAEQLTDAGPVTKNKQPGNDTDADKAEKDLLAANAAKIGAANASKEKDRKNDLADRIAAAIAVAHAMHAEAVERRDAVVARNRELADAHGKALAAYEVAKTKYDDELPKHKKAAHEASAVRRLDFTRRIQQNIDNAQTSGEAGAIRDRLDMWLRDIVKEFPGTPAADEAAARLRGRKPRDVTAPSVGPAPVEPKAPPMPRFENEGRPPTPVDAAKIAAEVTRRSKE